MKLSLSRVHFPVTTLGPGRRLGVWFQGCSIRCPGCISADTWRFASPADTLDAVMAQVTSWLGQADGLTVSGGEPFEQPEGLLALLSAAHHLAPHIDVLVYTGYPWEAESVQAVLNRAQGLIDALITDPFDLHSPQTRALRGSDNQRLHYLTTRGLDRFSSYERATSEQDRRLDVFFDETGHAWMAGIPARGDLQRLQVILAQQGHKAHTSEAPHCRARELAK